ncbi:hypothetical protein [Rhizobium laguerreae]|uniref:hypothetical protein n=1 Tax=Rhizobium laguerreae TaxID=1076926 RepID=UPI001C90E7A7|nr:hypothetical protein [Rhizobium laguerreae]MBY3197062.1 hypothetical protein [Rhizobium laguerreae]
MLLVSIIRARAKQAAKDGGTVLTIERSVVPIPQVGFYCEALGLGFRQQVNMEFVAAEANGLQHLIMQVFLHPPRSVGRLSNVQWVGTASVISANHHVDRGARDV